MPNVRKMRGTARLYLPSAVALAIVAIAFTACSSSRGDQAANSSSNHSSEVNFAKPTLARCLRDSGAVFADSPDQLAFLEKAEAEDAVTPYAFAYDKATRLSIELWSKAPNNDKREWLMWIGQPLEQEMSPKEIVRSAPSRSYVAYAIRPSLVKRRALEGCMNRLRKENSRSGANNSR
jgi:hypothetical protein